MHITTHGRVIVITWHSGAVLIASDKAARWQYGPAQWKAAIGRC
jgi:hypothetical protein